MGKSKTKYGRWALITGASSGIGEGFARKLAHQGYNLVLVARREDRLRALANEFEVETRVVPLDLTQPAAVDHLTNATKDLEIGLLINNAGIGKADLFLNRARTDIAQTLDLNVRVPMELAHVFGKKMADRGHGGILFVASTLGYQGVPYFADYSATKAHVLTLGEALHTELKPYGVDVGVLSPGGTKTEIIDHIGIDINKAPFPMMEVEPVVREGLAALGNSFHVVPGVLNRIMFFITHTLTPRRWVAPFFARMLKPAIPQEAHTIKPTPVLELEAASKVS